MILFFAGIDGQVDTRLIYGTIVAEEKDRLAKGDKVRTHIKSYVVCCIFNLLFFF